MRVPLFNVSFSCHPLGGGGLTFTFLLKSQIPSPQPFVSTSPVRELVNPNAGAMGEQLSAPDVAVVGLCRLLHEALPLLRGQEGREGNSDWDLAVGG